MKNIQKKLIAFTLSLLFMNIALSGFNRAKTAQKILKETIEMGTKNGIDILSFLEKTGVMGDNCLLCYSAKKTKQADSPFGKITVSWEQTQIAFIPIYNHDITITGSNLVFEKDFWGNLKFHQQPIQYFLNSEFSDHETTRAYITSWWHLYSGKIILLIMIGIILFEIKHEEEVQKNKKQKTEKAE